MHPLDKMMQEPIVAASFKWLDPPSTDGTPRRWRIRVPREIFQKYSPIPKSASRSLLRKKRKSPPLKADKQTTGPD
jgi:hypothetical protein